MLTLQDKDVHAVAVGIGKKIYKEELETIAGDDVILVDDFDALRGKLAGIESQMCGGRGE